VLQNVCPNCGGGFVPRPIRPKNNWHNDNFTGKYPPGTRQIHKPVDRERHRSFVKRVGKIDPHDR
ncbi:MAG: DUF1272 domain-containing protein, partial [Leptospiraceae bacterium]|nr:DUF1272 domain-containing protein [Leptospiraceae bacterium]